MNKNILGYAVLAVVAGLLVFSGSFISKTQVVQQTPTSEQLQQIVRQFGALSSPDIQSPYLCVNGVCGWYASGDCLDATTTPFSVLSPAATSTLDLLQVSGTVGTTTIDFVVATTSSPHIFSVGGATTTAYAPFFIDLSNVATSTYFCSTMGATGEGICKTAGSSSKQKVTIPPSTYITGYVNRAYLAMTTGFGIKYPGNTFSCYYRMHFSY